MFVQRVDDAKPRSITPKPTTKQPQRQARPRAENEPNRSPSAPSAATTRRSCSPAARAGTSRPSPTAHASSVFTLDDKNEEKNPRVSVLGWTPAGDALLVQFGERDRWDRGVMRLDLQTKQLTALVKDRNLYQNVRFSRDGSTVVYQMSDGDRPAELYVADASFRNARKLTDLNPWMASKALPVVGAGRLSRRRRQDALRRAALSGRISERANAIRPCSRSTRRSSTTASTAARRFSPTTATPSSTRR